MTTIRIRFIDEDAENSATVAIFRDNNVRDLNNEEMLYLNFSETTDYQSARNEEEPAEPTFDADVTGARAFMQLGCLLAMLDIEGIGYQFITPTNF